MLLFGLLTALLGAPPNIRLNPANDCINGDSIARSLGEQPVNLAVTIAYSQTDKHHALVELEALGRPTGSRRLSARNCTALEQAITLHLSLAFAAVNQRPRQEPLSTSEGAFAAERTTPALGWGLHASASTLIGATPAVALGGEIAFELAHTAFSARAGIEAHRTLNPTNDGQVHATRASLIAGACWHALPPLGLCLLSSLGVLTASSPDAPRATTSPVAALEARVYIASSRGNHYGAGLYLRAAATLAYTVISLDERLIWRSPVAWGGIGFDTFFASK